MTTCKPKARVLYVESCQDGTIGGSHHCLLHLVKGLDRSLYDPVVLFYQSHALLPAFQSIAETLVLPSSSDRSVRWGAARGRFFFPLVIARRIVNIIKLLCTSTGCISFLNRHRIALVHLNNSITRGHEWMYAAAIAGIPCVVSERGINTTYPLLDRAFARRFALIIPMSRWIMNHMVHHGVSPTNIRVMYDGLDPASIKIERSADMIRSTYNIRPDQPVIGIVGNVREWKGQETVVRALIEVSKVYPDVVCFFVGAATIDDGPYVSRLHTLIDKAGIRGNVRFTGYQADPASFVNVMDIVIHASVQPEPFGMVVLEAMAQHKPVIGARAGGVIEMVVEGQTGYTVPGGDWSLLASRIIDLLNVPDNAISMGHEGYKRLVTAFTFHRYMEQIHAAYQVILEKKPLPADLGIGFIRSRDESYA